MSERRSLRNRSRAVFARGGLAFVVVLLAILPTTSAAAADESVIVCGTVKAYQPPTASAAGSITIGTRTLQIAPGAQYGDPAGLSRPIDVGSNSCITGTRNDAGQLTRYGSRAFDSAGCGTVSAYTPASPDRPGSITLGTTARLIMKIPAGTDLGPDAGSGHQCFTFGIDALGDGTVTGRSNEGAVRVVGQPTASPAATGLAAGAAVASPTAALPGLPATLPSTRSDWVVPELAVGAALALLLLLVAWRVSRARADGGGPPR